jgi:5-methylcytosine-specific restriction endonuclease McrA
MKKYRKNASEEIEKIRLLIYKKQNGLCLWCGKRVTWKQAHMHERLFRGKGGKISLDNSIILCSNCHLNDAHGNRKPKFGRKHV